MPRIRSAADRVNKGLKQDPKIIDWCSPVQMEAFNYGPWPQCCSAGFAGGKTFAYCLKAMYLSDSFPGNRGIIARKVCKELDATTMSTFYKICDNPQMWNKGGRRADSEYYLRFNNGSEILFIHMDQEDIVGIIRGLEINWFFIDQAEEIEEELFDMLMSRLGRWDKATVPDIMLAQGGGIDEWDFKNPVTGVPMAPTFPMLACNPDTEMHWIYRRFHPDSFEWKQKYKDLGYKMFLMDARDNKFLPTTVLENMLAKDESFVRRFVRGEWGIPEGQIHTVDPLSIIPGDMDTLAFLLRTCRLGRALDHGDASPTCCTWWATDRDGNEWCLGEYYMPNKLIGEHRENITKLTEELFRGEYNSSLADPSIFHKTSQKYGGRWSVADEYSDVKNLPRENAIFWMAGDNNELGTRNRISEYLRVDSDRIHPVYKTKGSPRLFFLEANEGYPQGCNHAIRELRSQRRQRIGTDMGKPIFSDDRDMKMSDHSYDCIRYRIASRPALARGEVSKRSMKSFAAHHKRLLEFKQKGGFEMLRDKARRESQIIGVR